MAALQERYGVHKVNLVRDARLAPASFVLMDGSKTLRWDGSQQTETGPHR